MPPGNNGLTHQQPLAKHLLAFTRTQGNGAGFQPFLPGGRGSWCECPRLIWGRAFGAHKTAWAEFPNRAQEKKEKRRKPFPIRLMDFETLRDWTCFDADTGKDLAVEVREYYIPDFSNWKNHDTFEAEFARLQKALSDESTRPRK